MIVELRVYHCLPGRLTALHARFQNVTLALWEKHGIEAAGFFTTLKWNSLAERETRWNNFMADPEWIDKRAASEADAPIVGHIENSFLSPTAYSPMQ